MMAGEQLPLAVVGCDFRIAPSRVRSALVLPEERIRGLFSDLVRGKIADGLVDLNTCNRNEWLVSTENPAWAAELLKSQMMELAGPEVRDWFRPYVYTGEDAARHVFRVAVGLESLVVGERQIAGQLYDALETARRRRCSSRVLNGLGSIAGRLVRIALRRGCIKSAAVGVHSLALEYIRHRIALDRDTPLAIVGLGRIGRRLLGVMTDALGLRPVCVNRTVHEGAVPRLEPLDRLTDVLAKVRAAVVCTAAPTTLIGPGHFEAVRGPLLVLDIGIPEQVARKGLPDGVEVVGLDELVQFHRRHKGQGGANEEAERLVERAVEEFRAFCQEPVVASMLDTIHRHHRQLVGEEIPSIVDGRFGDLDPQLRRRLVEEFRSVVLEYTGEIFRTVKETIVKEPGSGNGERNDATRQGRCDGCR